MDEFSRGVSPSEIQERREPRVEIISSAEELRQWDFTKNGQQMEIDYLFGGERKETCNAYMVAVQIGESSDLFPDDTEVVIKWKDQKALEIIEEFGETGARFYAVLVPEAEEEKVGTIEGLEDHQLIYVFGVGYITDEELSLSLQAGDFRGKKAVEVRLESKGEETGETSKASFSGFLDQPSMQERLKKREIAMRQTEQVQWERDRRDMIRLRASQGDIIKEPRGFCVNLLSGWGGDAEKVYMKIGIPKKQGEDRLKRLFRGGEEKDETKCCLLEDIIAGCKGDRKIEGSSFLFLLGPTNHLGAGNHTIKEVLEEMEKNLTTTEYGTTKKWAAMLSKLKDHLLPNLLPSQHITAGHSMGGDGSIKCVEGKKGSRGLAWAGASLAMEKEGKTTLSSLVQSVLRRKLSEIEFAAFANLFQIPGILRGEKVINEKRLARASAGIINTATPPIVDVFGTTALTGASLISLEHGQISGMHRSEQERLQEYDAMVVMAKEIYDMIHPRNVGDFFLEYPWALRYIAWDGDLLVRTGEVEDFLERVSYPLIFGNGGFYGMSDREFVDELLRREEGGCHYAFVLSKFREATVKSVVKAVKAGMYATDALVYISKATQQERKEALRLTPIIVNESLLEDKGPLVKRLRRLQEGQEKRDMFLELSKLEEYVAGLETREVALDIYTVAKKSLEYGLVSKDEMAIEIASTFKNLYQKLERLTKNFDDFYQNLESVGFGFPQEELLQIIDKLRLKLEILAVETGLFDYPDREKDEKDRKRRSRYKEKYLGKKRKELENLEEATEGIDLKSFGGEFVLENPLFPVTYDEMGGIRQLIDVELPLQSKRLTAKQLKDLQSYSQWETRRKIEYRQTCSQLARKLFVIPELFGGPEAEWKGEVLEKIASYPWLMVTKMNKVQRELHFRDFCRRCGEEIDQFVPEYFDKTIERMEEFFRILFGGDLRERESRRLGMDRLREERRFPDADITFPPVLEEK